MLISPRDGADNLKHLNSDVSFLLSLYKLSVLIRQIFIGKKTSCWFSSTAAGLDGYRYIAELIITDEFDTLVK